MFFGLIKDHPRPRYLPGRAFPAYAHQPGVTPHPYRDEGGHSHGRGEPEVEPMDPEDPMGSEPYLYGFDLFNHGYFWEAHVWWEALWHAHGREGDLADLLKALIRLAAAGVKALAGTPGGVRSHCAFAAELLEGLEARVPGGVLAGVHLAVLAEHARSVGEATPDQGRHPDLEAGRFVWSLRPGDPEGRGIRPKRKR